MPDFVINILCSVASLLLGVGGGIAIDRFILIKNTKKNTIKNNGDNSININGDNNAIEK